MEDKPMSNEELESLIQKLDANKRFDLSKEYSSLRSIEKSVPLQIDTLTFDDLKIKVNDTEYKFGVYKKYHQKEETPRFVQLENDKGGSDFNVDQFGFNDYSQDFCVEKGDIVISSEEYWKEVWDEQFENNRIERSQERREWLERRIQDLRKQLTLLLISAPKSLSEIKMLQLKIFKYQSYLLPFHIDAGVRPYDAYTQLTISSPRGIFIERFEYNGNVHSSLKTLSTHFFGNRSFPIEVKRFEANEPLIRLPPGVKFLIHGLKVRYPISDVIENLKPIIDQRSYPLEYVEIDSRNTKPADLNHKIVREAEEVVITGRLNNEKWTPELEKMRNQRIEIRDGFEEDPIDDLYCIVSSWKRNLGAGFGSKVSIRIRDNQNIHELLDGLAKDFSVRRNNENHFHLPLNFKTDLKISKMHKKAKKNKEIWFIQLEIVPKNFYVESIALCARVMEKAVRVWNVWRWNF